MEEKINKILDLMIAGLEKAGSVAEAELPGLINDYVAYFIIQEVPVISPVIFLLGVTGFILLFRFLKREDALKEVGDVLGHLFFVFVALVCVPFAIAVSSAKDMAALYYAPKAALIEKFRGK